MTDFSFGYPADLSSLAWWFRSPAVRGANAETDIIS